MNYVKIVKRSYNDIISNRDYIAKFPIELQNELNKSPLNNEVLR